MKSNVFSFSQSCRCRAKLKCIFFHCKQETLQLTIILTNRVYMQEHHLCTQERDLHQYLYSISLPAEQRTHQ